MENQKKMRRAAGATPDVNGRTVDFNHLDQRQTDVREYFRHPKCVAPLIHSNPAQKSHCAWSQGVCVRA
jgi:hypothetical protein